MLPWRRVVCPPLFCSQAFSLSASQALVHCPAGLKSLDEYSGAEDLMTELQHTIRLKYSTERTKYIHTSYPYHLISCVAVPSLPVYFNTNPNQDSRNDYFCLIRTFFSLFDYFNLALVCLTSIFIVLVPEVLTYSSDR